MDDERQEKKGLLSVLWESMAKTGGCCGGGASCCGPPPETEEARVADEDPGAGPDSKEER